MVNWTTGEGTARYWVLRLLLDTFQAGDSFVSTVNRDPPQPVFCAELDTSIGTVTITCADPTAKINDIQFAAYGLPTGTCFNYTHNSACDATNVTDYVTKQCVGQNSCSILSYPTFGDPCFDVEKKFVIRATCTGTQGGNGYPDPNLSIFALGAIDVKTKAKKVLLINKKNSDSCVTITGATGGTMYMLDESSGFGPARKTTATSDNIALRPFAVSVIFLS